MPLHILRHDITLMPVDAIVSPGNERLSPTGGVAGLILQRGGPALAEACQRLAHVATGQAKLTRGFLLPCQYVIHTAGPVWQGGTKGEDALLRSCYRNCLALAADRGVETLAFPLISGGLYGYPLDQAMHIATGEIRAFLATLPDDYDMTVYLVVFSDEAFALSAAMHQEVTAYIDANYVAAHSDRRMRRTEYRRYESDDAPDLIAWNAPLREAHPCAKAPAAYEDCAAVPPEALHDELTEQLLHLDETFSQQLLRLIDERGLTDPDCYRRANIDRKLFSKIRSKADYKPSKPTAVALAVSLCLTMEETRDLLSRAGYALTRANKFDIIVEFFITRGIYNVDQINLELFAAKMPLLGS